MGLLELRIHERSLPGHLEDLSALLVHVGELRNELRIAGRQDLGHGGLVPLEELQMHSPPPAQSLLSSAP